MKDIKEIKNDWEPAPLDILTDWMMSDTEREAREKEIKRLAIERDKVLAYKRANRLQILANAEKWAKIKEELTSRKNTKTMEKRWKEIKQIAEKTKERVGIAKRNR